MKSTQVIEFCARLEEKLDARLFANGERDKRRSATPRTTDPAKIAKGAVKVGGAGLAIAGGVAARNVVKNRISGMRSTVPGFAQRSGMGQVAGAVGSLGRDALNTPVAKEAAYRARTVGRHVENAAVGVGHEVRHQATKAARYAENAGVGIGKAIGSRGKDVARRAASAGAGLTDRLAKLARKF